MYKITIQVRDEKGELWDEKVIGECATLEWGRKVLDQAIRLVKWSPTITRLLGQLTPKPE